MKKVFLADDEKFFRILIKDIIEEAGYEVVGEGENGEEAVKGVLETKPDIAILDIIMPVKTGLQAAEEIMEVNKDVKIVFLTSIEHEAIMLEAMASGVTQYLVKPPEKESLLKVLNEL